MRQGHRDDIVRWRRVTVEGGRVTKVIWDWLSLMGNIPAELGELDGLISLWLAANCPQLLAHSHLSSLSTSALLALRALFSLKRCEKI